jgi:putative hydrolases of HD superfamily
MSDRAFLEEALRLKEIARAGWVRAGIPEAESVADHSWGMALLALVLCPDDLDRERVLALAIVHDLAEVRVGDITPDEMPREEKRDRERRAAAGLLREHPRLWALWEDYEQSRSPEARFVHQLDKLDMGIQALRYGAPAEFMESAHAGLIDPMLVALLQR